MTRIHIVEPYHSAAMLRMSEPFQELSGLYEVTTGEAVDDAADVNIHMPWHTAANVEPGGHSKHIACYTHLNAGARMELLKACERADIITAMSYTGRRELIEAGADPKKVWVNYCSAGPYPYRRRVLAIVGYPQPTNRKRESLLFDLAWTHDLSQYEIWFVGAGWEETAKALSSLGVGVGVVVPDSQEKLQGVYHRIDALLVTGYAEGGPLPVLEAMATGCKIFAPHVGYAADLLEEGDLYSGPDDLMEKLNDYFRASRDGHYLSQTWTWHDYAVEYALLIGRMLGESVELDPRQGMARYAQLLDVIDEIRPKTIVEIGTWKGGTALRMIQQAAKYIPIEKVMYQGFDLFEGQTLADLRAEYSKGGWPQDVIQRRLSATGAGVMLVKGYTRDTLPQYMWDADLYFVDGGHSEETIEADGRTVTERMKPGSVAVFDDYYLPQVEGIGCNKFIASLPRDEYDVTMLPATTKADGREIAMVKVSRHADIRLQMPEPAYTYAVP